MHTLLPYLREWFTQKEEHFTAFAEADSRIEGWFKAELLVLLRRLVKQGYVERFEREAKVISPFDNTRKQIDFRITLQGQVHLCELKALCISQAAGTPRNLHFYFRDDHVGLIKDFKKLDELPYQNKWVFGFIYPSPNDYLLEQLVSTLPMSTRHWKLTTRPEDFPRFVFISLWRG